MLSLEALGVRERFTTFPNEVDFSELEAYTPPTKLHLLFWEDCLRGMEACDRKDLEHVVRPLIERGRCRFADPALTVTQEEAAVAQATLREVLDSTSWRITEPLRRGAKAVRTASHRRRR